MKQEQIQVRFKSRKQEYAVSNDPILVPIKLKRFGLSEIINHLLASETPVPFDFLIDGKFLKSSLSEYLDEKSLSTENILDVEYIESILPPKSLPSYPHEDWISSVAINKTLPLVMTGCYDGQARIWNKSGKIVATLSGNDKPIKSVKWLSESTCVTAGQSIFYHKINVGDIKTSKKTLMELVGHSATVESLACVREDYFASGSNDGTIKLWNLKESDENLDPVAQKAKKQKVEIKQRNSSVTLEGHAEKVSSLVYDETKNSLFSGGYDHTIRTWDIESESNTFTMNCECVVLDLDYSSESGLMVSGHSDNLIRIWDPRSKDGLIVKKKFSGHVNWVSGVCWDGMYTCQSASYDGSVKMWDIRSSSVMYSMGESKKLLGIDSRNGWICAGGEEGKLLMFN